jgi:hypothetical protein
MQFNNFFKQDELSILINELSKKYNINDIEVNDCINKALAECYGYERVTFNKDGSILGLKKELNSNVIKHHNISKKIYNSFQKKLSEHFYNKSFEKIEKKFKTLIITNQNIFYGKIVETGPTELKLSLYDKTGNRINNFFVTIIKKSKNIFKNELLNCRYDLDEGMLIYIPKREKIIEKSGIFSVKAVRKHPEIIRLKINSLFKEIKEKLGKSYGYEKVLINLKNKQIVIVSKLYFSEVVKNFLTEELQKIDEFKLIFINNKE